METVVNQLDQKVELKPSPINGAIFANIGGKVQYVGRDITDFFKDSEFNPVLLKDGSIIPYFRYNGQPVKPTREKELTEVLENTLAVINKAFDVEPEFLIELGINDDLIISIETVLSGKK